MLPNGIAPGNAGTLRPPPYSRPGDEYSGDRDRFLHDFINFHRTVSVFLIHQPATLRFALWLGHTYASPGISRRRRSSVGDEIVPRARSVNVVLVGVRKRSERRLPIVRLEAIKLKEKKIGLAGFHHRGIFKAVAETECPL